jgi:CelD/BcsL family acetyltransferase involved in cellulose biosynthesis
MSNLAEKNRKTESDPVPWNSGERVRLRIWSEREFFARKDDYRDLLSRSDADKLFMSWEWLTAWWQLHKEPFRLQLKVFAVEKEDGQVLGLAPMTKRSVRHAGRMLGTRMEPLGTLRGEAEAALTEYVTFPVDRNASGRDLTRRLAQSVFSDAEWDDLCLAFIPTESDTWRSLVEVEAGSGGVYVRPPDYLTARRIDLKDGFQAFLKGLGPKTRLRLYGGRKRLARIGPVEFAVADTTTFSECLAVLDQLHLERWGVPALIGLRGQLYRRIAEEGLADGSLSLSHLAVAGKPLAAALNFRREDSEYGIQLGLSRGAPKNVSPGYVQLGFMIERCCEDGLRYFDFLAGKGGESDYRRHFQAHASRVGSVQIIRSRRMVALYRASDLSKGLLNWAKGRPRQ